MIYSKENQVGRYGHKPKYKKPATPEASLQSFCDELLALKGIKNIRIPDNTFSWLAINAPFLCKALAGIADNVCMIPISDKYSLCLNLELKTSTGQLHGKQKINAKKLSWQIARSPEEITVIIEQFEKDVENLKERW